MNLWLIKKLVIWIGDFQVYNNYNINLEIIYIFKNLVAVANNMNPRYSECFL